ncbi:DUF7002 family protein [Pontivivens ytuae]|uniref:Uncharacterized protein n=1 Tax=Pontivivens ytuae TaxID=2789856 RepID=A0A7S9LV72_9RHOB|nr:hypothetical protein [Pontivivens ytuae]QPH55781.1 hypothetical protein I0K15_08695 [Pontivivens ytuae]
MTPDELAARHPRLYHVTEPGAWPSIARHGLLSTNAALVRFEAVPEMVAEIAGYRRPAAVPLTHPEHGTLILNDQLPLRESALATCLDDGLTPADWLRMLNDRVFFWPDESSLERLLGARINRDRPRDVLVFDTLSVAQAHLEQMELCPINSGATIRRPARRGLHTFTPVAALSYTQWQRRRGRRDAVREVTIRHALPHPSAHLIEIRSH